MVNLNLLSTILVSWLPGHFRWPPHQAKLKERLTFMISAKLPTYSSSLHTNNLKHVLFLVYSAHARLWCQWLSSRTTFSMNHDIWREECGGSLVLQIPHCLCSLSSNWYQYIKFEAISTFTSEKTDYEATKVNVHILNISGIYFIKVTVSPFKLEPDSDSATSSSSSSPCWGHISPQFNTDTFRQARASIHGKVKQQRRRALQV